MNQVHIREQGPALHIALAGSLAEVSDLHVEPGSK